MSVLQQYDPLRPLRSGFKHNNQPCFPNPEPGEMAPSDPFSPCGRRAGDEGEANFQATLRAIASCSVGASPKRSTR